MAKVAKMVEIFSAVTDYPAIIVSVIVGATILVIVYISNLFKSDKEDDVQSKTDLLFSFYRLEFQSQHRVTNLIC